MSIRGQRSMSNTQKNIRKILVCCNTVCLAKNSYEIYIQLKEKLQYYRGKRGIGGFKSTGTIRRDSSNSFLM